MHNFCSKLRPSILANISPRLKAQDYFFIRLKGIKIKSKISFLTKRKRNYIKNFEFRCAFSLFYLKFCSSYCIIVELKIQRKIEIFYYRKLKPHGICTALIFFEFQLS